MGEVIQVNQEITRILEYQKSDIVGQNISFIMPKVFAEKHNSFMETYFETTKSRVLNMQRPVYPVNKNGYVVACQLFIKILPNLQKGIQIVGFLNEEQKESHKGDFKNQQEHHYILFNQQNGIVQGISKSCYTSFGIPAAFVYG
jgi:PAS domain S-box-containing protein